MYDYDGFEQPTHSISPDFRQTSPGSNRRPTAFPAVPIDFIYLQLHPIVPAITHFRYARSDLSRARDSAKLIPQLIQY
jgi:hypothetical protein